MSELSLVEAQSRLNDYMRSRGMKVTRQREVILEGFMGLGKHVGVEELLTVARGKSPSIGHATVYRTMKLLVEAGIADERRFSTGVTLYEPRHGVGHHHDHLICTVCERIVEFENDEIEDLQEQVAEENGFRLTHHKMELYGICGTCQSEDSRS